MSTPKKFPARTVAICGVLAAFAMVLGYVEHLVPFPIGIYGIKLGLANLATLATLYLLGIRAAISVSLIRILLSALLFGNAVSLTYSLCGGVFALLVMILVKRTGIFSCIGVSICGGLSHNIAQLCVAIFMVDSLKIAFYLPVLVATGALTGTIIGICALPIIKNNNIRNACKR